MTERLADSPHLTPSPPVAWSEAFRRLLPRILGGAAIWCVLVGLVAVYLPLLTSRAGGAGLFEDDSYFYAQIAYNLGVHGLSSFDGINVTNGFHLLWGYLLGAVSWVVSSVTTDKSHHLVAMTGLYLGVAVGMAAFFGRSTVERIIVFGAAVFTSLLMETALVAALLLVTFSETLRDERRRDLREVALFFLPLARIDAILFVPGIVAAAWNERRWRSVLPVLLPVALGVLTQVAWCYIAYGEPFSVSAKIKAEEGFSVGRALAALGRPYAATVTVALVASTVLIVCAKRDERTFRTMLLMASLWCFYGAHLLLNSNGLRDWYTVLLFAGAAYLAFQTPARPARLVVNGLFCVLLGGLGLSRAVMVTLCSRGCLQPNLHLEAQRDAGAWRASLSNRRVRIRRILLACENHQRRRFGEQL